MYILSLQHFHNKSEKITIYHSKLYFKLHFALLTMTLVTLCTPTLIPLLCWTEIYGTWLVHEFCLNNTKLKDQKHPLLNQLKTKAFFFIFYLSLSLSLSLSLGCVHRGSCSPQKLVVIIMTISCYNNLIDSTPLEEHLDGQDPTNGGLYGLQTLAKIWAFDNSL